MSILDPRQYNVSPVNNSGEKHDFRNQEKKVNSDNLVKTIWKLKEVQLEREINLQKLKLSSDILQLKEKEADESQLCACRSFCRIFHKKHNWKKPASQDLVQKFRSLEKAYPCKMCDEAFPNVDCLNLHEKIAHTERENGEISM